MKRQSSNNDIINNNNKNNNNNNKSGRKVNSMIKQTTEKDSFSTVKLK